MDAITNQDLQKIAVQCTSDFFNHQVPLSEGLAKQASELHLNPEQIKRAVEATNTLTFLKQASTGGDRTAEFTLADFNEVLRSAFLPKMAEETETTRTDQASDTAIPKDDAKDFDFSEQNVEKQAEYITSLGESALLAMIQKEAMVNARALEDAIGRSEVLLSQIQKQAGALRSDERALEKLASVSGGDGQVFDKVAYLIFGEQPALGRPDYAEYTVNLREAEPAKNLVALVKEAEELVAEIKYRRGIAERTSLEKQAGLLMNIAGKVGSKALAGIKNVAGVPGRAAGSLGHGIGSTLTAPFRFAGKAIGKATTSLASAGYGYAKRGVNNAAANTTLGAKAGLKPMEPSPEAKKNLAKIKKMATGTAFAATAAADVAFYSPSVKPDKDQSGDVYKALNG